MHAGTRTVSCELSFVWCFPHYSVPERVSVLGSVPRATTRSIDRGPLGVPMSCASHTLLSPPLSFLVCAREWTMTRSRVFLFKNHKRCVCHLVDTPRGLTVLLLYTLVTFVAVTRRCCIHLSRLTPRRDLIGIPTFLSPDSISPKLVETIFAPLAPSDNTS